MTTPTVIVGQTATRGTSWMGAMGLAEFPTTYEGFVPVTAVENDLFGWELASSRVAVEVPATIDDMTHLSETGEPRKWQVQTDRQAITRSDNNAVMGMFKEGYQIHQYRDWLVNNVSTLIGDTLGISSAGLLKGGRVAFVEVGLDHTFHNRHGVEYRSNILAITSSDGTIATGYKSTNTLIACDNQIGAVLREDGGHAKFRHTRNSALKLADTRQVLGLLESKMTEFDQQINALVEQGFTERQFDEFLNIVAPLVDSQGDPLVKNSLSLTERKRDGITTEWNSSSMSSTWNRTAFGALQAASTYEQHHSIVRNSEGRYGKNIASRITGKFEDNDKVNYEAIERVLASA